MKEFLNQSVFFGVAISVLTYELGVFLKKKLKWPICNPLLISIVAVIIFLVAFDIPYEIFGKDSFVVSGISGVSDMDDKLCSVEP